MATRSDAATRPARPLKVGLNLPTVDGSMAGRSPRWTDLLALARQAEACGFDSLWVPDHMLVSWQEHARGVWEGWSLLAALAAATERVELGPLVSPVAFRNPTLLAKMADTVDEISGGRLVLGVGAGWDAPEYAAFGHPSDRRVDRLEEALRIVVPLLRTGRVDFEGRFYRARDCELRPRGPRPTGPPILIGAKGPRMLRLAATYADHWNVQGPLRRPADVAPLREAGDAACAAIGRDPATLGRSASVVVDLSGAQGEGGQPVARPDARPQPPPPELVAETLRAYAREGLGHVQLWLSPCTVEGIESFASALELLDRV
jgi:alkanesulfonate monooxygenase SsuD/methylene tetrahydromethanopterin reductase-like flavin-dependent oxidoreductase (luciferase family)